MWRWCVLPVLRIGQRRILRDRRCTGYCLRRTVGPVSHITGSTIVTGIRPQRAAWVLADAVTHVLAGLAGVAVDRHRRYRWRQAKQDAEVGADVGVAVDGDARDLGAVRERPCGRGGVSIGRPSLTGITGPEFS